MLNLRNIKAMFTGIELLETCIQVIVLELSPYWTIPMVASERWYYHNQSWIPAKSWHKSLI